MTEKWNTPIGSSVQAAATFKMSDYDSLDFLSDRARASILWKVASAVADDATMVEHTLHPDRIQSVFYCTVRDAIDRHGLGTQFTDSWKSSLAYEFLSTVTEYRWNAIYNENKFFDDRVAYAARVAANEAERKARELENARRLLAESGE